jgi:type IV secretion system protein VirD4
VQALAKWNAWNSATWSRIVGASQIAAGLVLGIAGAAIFALTAVKTSGWVLVLALAPLGWGYKQIATGGRTLRRFTDAPGTARMGSRRDLEQAHLTKEEHPHEGIYCGKFKKSSVFYNGDRHIITVGPTRKGKDTGLLVPNLAHLKRRSVFVIDPKGELAAITAAYRRKLGPVIIINPFGVLGLKSDGFNPLADPSFHPGETSFFANAMGLSEAMIKNDPHGPHWTESARALVSCAIMRAKWFEMEGKTPQATIGHVNAMLTAPHTSDKESAVTLQKIMQEIAKHPDEQMARLAPRFIPDNKEVLSVIATALGQTKFLNDRTLVADMDKHPTVSGKPFGFEMMKRQVITVYVILPDDMILTHAVWLRMVIASALNSLKRSGPGRVRPVLMLNEVGNLGRLEPLESGMGMAAGKGITIWTIWQSLAQMKTIYDIGFETFISGAGVFNAFGANDQETADYVSTRLGSRTEVVRSYSANDKDSAAGKSDTPTGFPLLHPSDVMALKNRKLLSWIEPSSVPFELDAPGYWDLGLRGMEANPYYEKRT